MLGARRLAALAAELERAARAGSARGGARHDRPARPRVRRGRGRAAGLAPGRAVGLTGRRPERRDQIKTRPVRKPPPSSVVGTGVPQMKESRRDAERLLLPNLTARLHRVERPGSRDPHGVVRGVRPQLLVPQRRARRARGRCSRSCRWTAGRASATSPPADRTALRSRPSADSPAPRLVERQAYHFNHPPCLSSGDRRRWAGVGDADGRVRATSTGTHPGGGCTGTSRRGGSTPATPTDHELLPRDVLVAAPRTARGGTHEWRRCCPSRPSGRSSSRRTTPIT